MEKNNIYSKKTFCRAKICLKEKTTQNKMQNVSNMKYDYTKDGIKETTQIGTRICNKDGIDDQQAPYKEDDWDESSTFINTYADESKNARSSNMFVKKHSLGISEHYKVVRFYIKDLRACQRVEEHFIFKNIPFIRVFITGTIVKKIMFKEKLSLEVHDGSDNITCLLEDSFLSNLKEVKENAKANMKMKTQSDMKYPISQAVFILQNCTQNIWKNVPSCKEDLQVGDIVYIIGKLSEHNEKRYIFIQRITACSTVELINNLQDLSDYYHNYI